MTPVEELWQERLVKTRVKMCSAIKPEILAERYSVSTRTEIQDLTNEAVQEMIRSDNGKITLRDLDAAAETLDEAGDEIVTDGGNTESLSMDTGRLEGE